jgi:hypothetical protein
MRESLSNEIEALILSAMKEEKSWSSLSECERDSLEVLAKKIVETMSFKDYKGRWLELYYYIRIIERTLSRRYENE